MSKGYVANVLWSLKQFQIPDDPSTLFNLYEHDMRYVIWQITEDSEDSVYAHCYIQFRIAKSRYFVENLFNGVWNPASRDLDENENAVQDRATRIAGPWSLGYPKRSGQRSDLLAIKEQIDNGSTVEEIAEDYFSAWTRNYHAFEQYRFKIQQKRSWPTIVIVFTGRTNIGKSRFVHEHATSKGPYFKQCNKDWFTHYTGQSDVVLDEFYGTRFSYSYLLQLLDRYPHSVGSKGGEINFIPRRIWITSNVNPSEWYKRDTSALERRITYHREILDSEEFPIEEIENKLKELNVYDN